MAENEKNTAKNSQSRMMAVDPKYIEIVQKNPDLIHQLQSRTRVLDELQSQMKETGPKYSYQKSPQSNSQLNQVVNTSSKFNLYQMVNKANKYLSPFYLGANIAEPFLERIVKGVKEPKDALIEFGKIAKKFGHPKWGEQVDRLGNKMPKNFSTKIAKDLAQKFVHSKFGAKAVGLNQKPPNFLAKIIRQMARVSVLGKQEQQTELLEIGKKVKKLGNPSLIKEYSKISKAFKLKNVFTGLKGVKGLGLVGTAFDIKSLVELTYKLAKTGKLSRGEWAEAGISGASLVGTVLGGIAVAGGIAALGPVAAIIGIAAATAGVTKFIYDEQSDQRKKQIKALVKQIGRGYLKAQPLLYRNIPTNARGTSYFRGGLSLVGEEGPELVNLPRGSQVFSHSRTQSLLKGMGSGSAGIAVSYSPQIIIQGNADAKVMKTASDSSYADFERKFNALMDRRRRLSFAGG
jgi:hypothetical protein